MDTKVRAIDRLCKRFDKTLYARRGDDGTVRVFHSKPIFKKYDLDGTTIVYPVPNDYLVFSLTKNWSAKAEGCDWGLEPLYWKLREISLERQDQLFKEMELLAEQARQSKDRNVKNWAEDTAREQHAVYKKTFKDVLTHSLDQTKDPRRKTERKIKWR